MRIRWIVAAAVTALAMLPVATAGAQEDTDTSFDLTGGALSISAPLSATLGSQPVTASTLAGQLGTVTVTDDRAALVADWTATVSSTNFTTGTATASETITNTNVAYNSGTATSSGDGTFTPGVLATMAAPGTGGAWVGTLSNSSSWDPTVTVTIPAGRVAGTYSGTITHSVA
jgi:hypothetical protein